MILRCATSSACGPCLCSTITAADSTAMAKPLRKPMKRSMQRNATATAPRNVCLRAAANANAKIAANLNRICQRPMLSMTSDLRALNSRSPDVTNVIANASAAMSSATSVVMNIGRLDRQIEHDRPDYDRGKHADEDQVGLYE